MSRDRGTIHNSNGMGIMDGPHDYYLDELAITQVVRDGMRLPLRGQELSIAVHAMYGRVPNDIIAWRLYIPIRRIFKILDDKVPHKRKQPETKRKRKKPTENPCGTLQAYWRHKRRHESPCAECRKAGSEYKRKRYWSGREYTPLRPCGTRAAYLRHKRRGEKACDPCLEASQKYHRDRRERRMRGRVET